ncbi:unnamed protein product [Prorocentrum cordatum]|uniref:Potassium channel domain-containing protein n=1 Tax=Prorocentrum cordatum TaxID=2364126 RepID=A0ABN9WYM3_9DINO|nr:unnamed protein product [Polarella glacialis]
MAQAARLWRPLNVACCHISASYTLVPKRDGMGRSGVFHPRFMALRALFFPLAVSLDTKDIHIHAEPGSGVAQRAPGQCETRVHELAMGIAAEVRDLATMAQEMQLSTGGAAQPFARQLLTIATRIAARLDQHQGARGALVAPEITLTVSPVYWNATGASAHGEAEGDPETRRGAEAKEDGIVPHRDPNLPKDWGIRSPEGGSDHSAKWDIWVDEGVASHVFALVFIAVVASAPIVPHLRKGAERPTKAHLCESFCLFVWLFSGLYLFTRVLVFQSPHFESNRTLRLEESVYLISQIVTTVGYGDITPAEVSGQLVVGVYVFLAIIVISKIVGDLVSMFENAIEDTLLDDVDEATLQTHQEKLWAAFVPVMQSGGVFLLFMLLGAVFFCMYPGEDKTLGQAIYMSMITLSSVGFGAFTPVTRGGMVFGAYWMLFGVGSLGALVSARVAFTSALIRYERDNDVEDAEGKSGMPFSRKDAVA